MNVIFSGNVIKKSHFIPFMTCIIFQYIKFFTFREEFSKVKNNKYKISFYTKVFKKDFQYLIPNVFVKTKSSLFYKSAYIFDFHYWCKNNKGLSLHKYFRIILLLFQIQFVVLKVLNSYF